ncbi:ABC transporter substrate-binding protein [Alicyclobacillus macrosporangiidus]|uniref:Branched-chain amino acid transport system substrate-binding protein n=1 Tax=Alicyclobacillus macrosporangiidus TaxID=392015 RepID=A0A1I7IH43_9BACL|nr:ABC transporter substrate-binding protein [Alicyclobacillus macrosporangiidus]SFU72244.1 branched-chain amino acid transport system substrate-binding protein [Alicyclobacillus macrosporangiidus]
MHNRRPARMLATLTLAGLFALAGCGTSGSGASGGSGNTGGGSAGSGDNTLTLGVITSITGADSEFGKAQKEGYEVALDEINAAGGILGKQVKLVYLDDKSSAQEAAKDVDQLVSQYHAQIILGPYSSGSALAVVKKADTYKIPDIVPTATAANVTQTGSKYVFRLCATSDDYAKAICELLKQQGDAKTMAIVHEDQNFGTSADKAMVNYAKQYGFEVVDDESYSTKDLDYKAMLQRVKQKHPDVIYFASYSKDAVALMKQAQEIDLNAKYFTAAGTGFSVGTFPQDAGPAAEYTLAAGQWDPSAKWPGAKEFYDKVHAKFGDYPSYHDMEAYAALYVAKEAIEQAGAYDGQKIRDALASLQMETAFGPVHFDSTGQNAHPVIVTQIQNGKFVTVFPSDAATGKLLPTPPWSQRK